MEIFVVKLIINYDKIDFMEFLVFEKFMLFNNKNTNDQKQKHKNKLKNSTECELKKSSTVFFLFCLFKIYKLI